MSRSFLVITHYQRLLDYIVPDYVHVLADGKIIKSGDKQLALELEETGYTGVGDELLNETSLISHYRLQHQMLLTTGEPDWLKAYRSDAFAEFVEQGIPSTMRETWKYTPLRMWSKNNFYNTPKIETITQLQELQLFSMLDDRCQDIIVVDGIHQPQLSTPSPIKIFDYAQAIKSHAQMIENYLGQAVKHAEHPFASLCDALAQKGVVFIVPDNTIIDNPIHILYVASKNSQDCVNHIRNLFIIGKNSKVEIIEHYVNLADTSYFNNILTEVILEQNAKFVTLQIRTRR